MVKGWSKERTWQEILFEFIEMMLEIQRQAVGIAMILVVKKASRIDRDYVSVGTGATFFVYDISLV